jgi:hypothetical protein
VSDLDLGTLTGYLELDESGVGEAVSRALDWVKDFGTKGVVIAGAAGLAIAGAIGASIVAGMDLEAGRDKLAAELGLTEQESARIGKVAGALFAQNYGDSMDGVNEAVSAVMTSIDGMSTASSKQLQSVSIDALNFAKVFDVDISRAAQIAGQAVRTGLADNATEAFDLITAASQRVPKAVREDVLDAADEYGQFFSTLGYSGKQAFALLVDASAKGMYGIDKAGDAVKEFTIRSTDMSKSSKDAYKAIGLDAQEMANDILAGGDRAQSATQRIISGLLSIKDPAAQGQAAIALFGTPLEDLNTSEIPAFLKSLKGGSDAMDGFGGASKRMDKTLNDNAIASLGTLKRQATVAFYALGNWALPKVNALAAAMSANFGPSLVLVIGFLQDLWGALQTTVGFVQSNQTTFIIIAGVITALLLPAFVAWGTAATIAGARSVAAFLAAKIGAVQSAAMHVVSLTLITVAWVRAGVQSLVAAARMAAAWVIALGPIGWAIAAVALIVAVIIKYWDQISAATGRVWNWVSSKVSGAINWVVGFVRAHWPLLLAIITGPLGLIVLAVSKNLGRIRGFFSSAWNAVRSGASAAWNGITGIISGGAARIMASVRAIPGRLRSLVSSFGGMKNAGGIVSGIAGNVWSAVKGLLNNAIGKLRGALNFTIGIPGPDIHVNVGNSIPYLAAGGYVDRPTVAMIGEAGPEAVVPLSGRNGANARDALGLGAGMTATDTKAGLTDEDRNLLREFIDAAWALADRDQVLAIDGRQAGKIYKAGKRADGRL